MGVPRTFQIDNGQEYSNSIFVDICNDIGVRHEFTAPYTPQQNGPVESAISRAFNAGYAARLEIPQLYPDICLQEVRGCTDAAWNHSSWYRSVSTGRQHQRTTSDFPRMKVSTGTARDRHCCPSSSSPPITKYHDSARRIPGPGCVIY